MPYLYLWVVLAVFLPSAVSGAPAGVAKPRPVVEVLQTSEVPVDDAGLTMLGVVRPNESVVLRPEISGRVTDVGFTEGQTVRRGQLLVKLDDALLVAELSAKMAAVELLEMEYKRLQTLGEQGQVAALDVERKRTEWSVAKSALAVLKARIAQTEIRSPFDGLIGLRLFSPGEVVQAGQALVSVTSFSPLKADVKIPEAQARWVHPGQTVRVEISALPGVSLQGHVSAVESRVDDGTRAVWVRLVLKGGDRRIRSGMSAKAVFKLPSASDAHIQLPEQAVVAQGGKTVVYRVTEGKASAVPVKVGLRRAGRVTIMEGVKPGEIIVVSGQNKLSRPEIAVETVPFRGTW